MGPSSATSPSTACQMGQFRVFCESVPRETLLLGLLVILGAARSTRVLQFDKRSGGYHTSFNHQRSTKSLSQAQKCMQTKWHDEMARNLKAHILSRAFPRKNWYAGVFFFLSNAILNHTLLEDFSQTNGNRLVGAPRAHFRQKLKIDNWPELLL